MKAQCTFALLSSPYKAPFFPTPSQCTSELESPANVLCFFVHNSPLFWKQRWIFCYPTPWNSVSQSFLAPLMDLPPLNRVCVSSIPSLSLSIRAPRGFWDLHYLPHLQLKWIVFFTSSQPKKTNLILLTPLTFMVWVYPAWGASCPGWPP